MLALLAALGLAASGCGMTTPSTPSATGPASVSACDGHVDRNVLPPWARAGFSDPEPIMPHVVSVSGEITAILFGDPLTSPPSTARTNKILWVLREGDTGVLAIKAQRMDGTSPVGAPAVRQMEHFPGPSTIDLPEPGCWRLTLTWADRTDTLDLEYVSPVAAAGSAGMPIEVCVQLSNGRFSLVTDGATDNVPVLTADACRIEAVGWQSAPPTP